MAFENVYNLDKLKPAIEQAKDERARAIANGDVDNPDGESVSWVLDTVSSGAAGQYQPGEIADALNLDAPDDCIEWDMIKLEILNIPYGQWKPSPWNQWEFAWEEIDSQVSALDDWLNAALQDSLGCEYSLYHGSNESDGAYELFLSFSPCDSECSLRKVVRSFLAKEAGFSDLKEVLR